MTLPQTSVQLDPPASAGPVVLCVDDEPAILRALERSLRREPYCVETTTRPVEALERLGAGDVAVLLTDQRMPSMSGVDLLRAARERHPNTARVLLTGYADMRAIAEAVNECELQALYPKPWDDAELQIGMRRMIEHRRGETGDDARARLDVLQRLLQRQTHRLLHAQEMLDRIPNPVALVEPVERTLLYPNRAFVDLLGDSSGRPLRGRPVADVFAEDVCRRIDKLMERPAESVLWDVHIAGRIGTMRFAPVRAAGTFEGLLVYIEL